MAPALTIKGLCRVAVDMHRPAVDSYAKGGLSHLGKAHQLLAGSYQQLMVAEIRSRIPMLFNANEISMSDE